MESSNFIQEKDYVAITTRKDMKGYHTKIVCIEKGRMYKVKGRKSLPLKSLIGKEYNQWFRYEQRTKELTPVSKHPYQVSYRAQTTTSDNRGISDLGKVNQQLSSEDIEGLKTELSGDQIVDKLIEGSQTFSEKTSFSQAKYTQRKKVKFLPHFIFRKPTLRAIVASRFRVSQRNCIRFDMLSFMLLHSNIHAGTKAMIFDEINGMFLAAAYQKMDRRGKLIRVFTGSHESNFHSLRCLPCYQRHSRETKLRKRRLPTGTKLDLLQEFMVNVSVDYFYPSKRPVLEQKREFDARYYETIVNASEGWKVDSLVIATIAHDTSELFRILFPCLKTGGIFAVYHNCRRILEELTVHCQNSEQTSKVSLYSIFGREFQVLEKRTHPMVNMSQESGYCLRGYKIDPTGTKKKKMDVEEEEEVEDTE